MHLVNDPVAFVCPECGYDLRGIASSRCPECGLELAKIGPSVSTIPWEHRHKMGRVRAWLRTVWRFSVPYQWFRFETARPTSIVAARRFWLVTATLLSALPIALFEIERHQEHGLGFLFERFFTPDKLPAYGGPIPGLEGMATSAWFSFNVSLPWVVGFTRPGIAELSIWLAVVLVTGVHTYLFHPRGLERRRADRAITLSYYLIAPFVFPALLAGCSAIAIASVPIAGSWVSAQRYWTYGLSDSISTLVLISVTLNALLRVPNLLRQTTRCSWLYTAFACAALPLMWLFTLAIVLVCMPWAIGVGWLAIRAIF